jgi:hypothetical protein
LWSVASSDDSERWTRLPIKALCKDDTGYARNRTSLFNEQIGAIMAVAPVRSRVAKSLNEKTAKMGI